MRSSKLPVVTYRNRQQLKRAIIAQAKELLAASLRFFPSFDKVEERKRKHLDTNRYSRTAIHLYYANKERVPRTFTVCSTSERRICGLLPSEILVENLCNIFGENIGEKGNVYGGM